MNGIYNNFLKCSTKHFILRSSKLLFDYNGSTFLSQRKDLHLSHSQQFSSKWKPFYAEKKAVHRLLERSGISYNDQLTILRQAIHLTSANSNIPSNPPHKDEPKPNDNDNNQNLWRKFAMIFAIFYLVSVIAMSSNVPPEKDEDSFVSWNEFSHNMLAKGEVKEVIVKPNSNLVTINLHDGAIIKGKRNERFYHMNYSNLATFESRLRDFEASLGIKPDQGVPVFYQHGSVIQLRHLLYLLLLLICIFFFLNPPKIEFGLKNMTTKAKYTLIDPLMPGSGKGVKFSHVAGAHEAKQEVMEFVDFLKNPAKYQKLGAKIPKGALLLGPPGCGKTLLAKAVATEGSVPFLAMNGSEFIELVGGLGAARVRDLFKEAKKRTPAIIYIDELDAIGRKRSADAMGSNSGEEEQTLNQLLVEMDGLLTKKGIIVLGSTNRVDVLDKALLRPGRFDRHIMMDYPTLEDRREIFEHHLKSIILEKPVSFYSRRMASLTLSFTGADIANVVNEAALYAARNAKTVVSGSDLEYAVERVVGGTEKRSQVLSPEEKKVVAYHESGHALVGWLLKNTDALLKITIVPRTNHVLGFAQYSPKDKKLYTQEEILEKMCMALGGRVAESLTFNKVTTGAQNDLEKVTKMAYAQVKQFGFSDRVGKVSFMDKGKDEGKRPYSQKLAATIDDEASKLIFEAYKKTEEILKKNMDKLKLLAEALLQKESLSHEDVEVILGPPPHGQKVMIEPQEFENEIGKWKGDSE